MTLQFIFLLIFNRTNVKMVEIFACFVPFTRDVVALLSKVIVEFFSVFFSQYSNETSTSLYHLSNFLLTFNKFFYLCFCYKKNSSTCCVFLPVLDRLSLGQKRDKTVTERITCILFLSNFYLSNFFGHFFDSIVRMNIKTKTDRKESINEGVNKHQPI